MSEWTKCRKRPVVVEFREVDGEQEEIVTLENKEKTALIAKRDEDFIIRGVRGEIYPIKKEIFYDTYEVIE